MRGSTRLRKRQGEGMGGSHGVWDDTPNVSEIVMLMLMLMLMSGGNDSGWIPLD